LAPAIPAVDILIDGAAAITDLAYGDSSGRQELAAGTYNIAIALAEPGGAGGAGGGAGGSGGSAGPTIVLDLGDVPLAAGDDITVIAYRSGEEPPAAPVGVFNFSNSTEGLTSGQGRVFVGHGADDSALNPVDVIVTDADACPPPLLDQFAFGTDTGTNPLDLDGGTVNLGFDLDPGDCTAEVAVADVPVTADVVSILVAVDEDTTEGLDVELWAIVDASDTPVALINQ
jgi:hypothetical protein